MSTRHTTRTIPHECCVCGVEAEHTVIVSEGERDDAHLTWYCDDHVGLAR